MKTIKALLLLPALMLAGWFGVSQASAHEPAEHVVRMLPGGFEPSKFEVTQGDTVTFINEDSGPRWPASDIHPTHQIYSEFDAKEPLAPGASWSFKADRSGLWKFHDHVRPELTGEIRVHRDEHASEQKREDEHHDEFGFFTRIKIWFAKFYFNKMPKQAAAAMKDMDIFDLTELGNKDGEQELRYKLAVFGPKMIMDELLVKSGNGAIRDCHQPSHVVGRIGYELYGAEAFKDGGPECHSGFYHGAMEGLIKEKGVDNLAVDISELCSTFDTQFGNFQCYHGVGHGVVAFENYNLPAALKLCDQLPSSYARSGCYGGSFMENIMVAQGFGAIQGHETEWINNDPHYPCNAISQDQFTQYECYQMQTSWMRTLYNEDGNRIIEQCLKAPEGSIPVCFRSWGRDLASIYLRDVNQIARGCEAVPKTSNYYDQCISGGLNVVIDFWGGRLQDEAAWLCYLVPEDHKHPCYYELAYRVKDIFGDPTQFGQVCRHIEANYQYLCEVSS